MSVSRFTAYITSPTTQPPSPEPTCTQWRPLCTTPRPSSPSVSASTPSMPWVNSFSAFFNILIQCSLAVIVDCAMGAWLGHDGFMWPGSGDYFHMYRNYLLLSSVKAENVFRLHHKHFDCNYGAMHVPLDWLLGTYAGSKEEVMMIEILWRSFDDGNISRFPRCGATSPRAWRPTRRRYTQRARNRTKWNKSKVISIHQSLDPGINQLSYIFNEIHDLAIARSSSSCAVPALSWGI